MPNEESLEFQNEILDLIESLDSPDDEFGNSAMIREAAARALAAIRPEIRETLPALLKAIDIDPVRRKIVASLRWLGMEGLTPFLKAHYARMRVQERHEAEFSD